MSDELFQEVKSSDAETPVVTNVREPFPPALSEDPTVMLMQMAKDLDVDKLQRLIDMRNAQEEREAKREFDLHFAEMKAELPAIGRVKQGDKAKYAPIEEMQRQCDPVIARHKFSYSWNEVEREDGKLEIILSISGYGYSKINIKVLPVYEPDKGRESGKSIMNSLQAEGVRSSYGRRYTFINGFGLTVEDEDTDGSYEDALKYAEQVMAIRSADRATIIDVWKEIYTQFKSDLKAITILTAEYEKRKKQLSKGAEK